MVLSLDGKELGALRPSQLVKGLTYVVDGNRRLCKGGEWGPIQPPGGAPAQPPKQRKRKQPSQPSPPTEQQQPHSRPSSPPSPPVAGQMPPDEGALQQHEPQLPCCNQMELGSDFMLELGLPTLLHNDDAPWGTLYVCRCVFCYGVCLI